MSRAAESPVFSEGSTVTYRFSSGDLGAARDQGRICEFVNLERRNSVEEKWKISTFPDETR
jgi:hypothetical protein